MDFKKELEIELMDDLNKREIESMNNPNKCEIELMNDLDKDILKLNIKQMRRALNNRLEEIHTKIDD